MTDAILYDADDEARSTRAPQRRRSQRGREYRKAWGQQPRQGRADSRTNDK